MSGRLYQSHRGTDNNIYTRSSTDGLNWTGWLQTGGQTPDAPSLAALNGRLYQSHQGLDNKIYTRSSTDGLNWTGWSEAGGMTLTDRATNWKAEFFNGISIDPVNPGLVQDWGIGDNDLSKNWGIGSPGIGISTDNFSARFTTTRYFAPGLWKVESQADDGLRVRVGNQDVISRWVD